MFCVIGLGGTLIHSRAVVGSIELSGESQFKANFQAFLLGNMFSYVCNAVINFRHSLAGRQYIKFLLTLLVNLLLIMTLSLIGDTYHINYIIILLIIIGLLPILNFSPIRHFVFR